MNKFPNSLGLGNLPMNSNRLRQSDFCDAETVSQIQVVRNDRENALKLLVP